MNQLMEHHELRREEVYPTGAEEWSCSACSYRIVAMWPYVIILDRGQSDTVHNARRTYRLRDDPAGKGQSSTADEEEGVELSDHMIEQLEGLNWDGDDHEA